MRVVLIFLILILAAGGITVVSVLLIKNVNQPLGWIVMSVLIILWWPLVQRLHRMGKLLHMEKMRRPVTRRGFVVILIVVIGYMSGLSYILENWYEGWGEIVWLVGPLVAFGLTFFWGLAESRDIKRDAKREHEWLKLTMYQNVVEKPGISHIALLRSVEPSGSATDVLRQLLNEKRIKRERTGRVRRYFAQSEDYDEAIRQNPEDAENYYNRGIIYKLEGNKAKAIADFEKSITLTDNPLLITSAKQQIEELSK